MSNGVATTTQDGNNEFSSAYLRYALGLLFVVNVVNYMDRTIIGVLIEPMRVELDLTDTQIGLMSGFAFVLFYAIAGIYLAHLADTHSRRKIMSLSIVAWSAMTALTGAAQSFWQLLLARVGVGIGEASVIPAANALIADYHRVEHRPFALAVFTSGAMIGVMLGSFLGGAVAASYGWRWAFVIGALPGLPLAAVLWWTLREPRRGGADGPANIDALSFKDAMRWILSSRILILLMLGYSFIVFMLFGVITWFPAFLMRHHDMGLAEVGGSFGLAMGLGTAFGAIVGGVVANRLAARDLTWLTRLPTILLLAIWPLYEIAIFAPTATLSLAMLALVGAVGGGSYGPVLAAMQTVLPPAIRAKGAALNGFAAGLIGVGGGPLVVGMLSDHFAPTLGSGQALQRGLAIGVSVAIVGVLFMFFAHRSFVRWLGQRPDIRTRK